MEHLRLPYSLHSSRATQQRTERMTIRDLWIAFALSPLQFPPVRVPQFCINSCLPRWQLAFNGNFPIVDCGGQEVNQLILPSQKVNNIFTCSPRWLWLAVVFNPWGLVLLCLWLAQKCSKAPYKHFLNWHQTIYAVIQFRDSKSFLIPDYRNQMSRVFWKWSLEVKVFVHR